MHPFAEGDLACARADLAKCEIAIRKLITATEGREQGLYGGEALRWVGQAQGRLRAIAEIDEMQRNQEAAE